jgi:alginate O-acetyltransferase complex protein AlgI
MVFSSISFLFAFLPVVLLLYFTVPRALRNTLLLLASLFFYAWGGGIFVLLLLASCASNYVLGLLVARVAERRRARSLCIAGSVAVNLAILGTFKYANFAVSQWDALAAGLGQPPLVWTALALPIGISFYTFQSMSYVFDVARGAARPFRNPLDFALYVSMFPQLIAGPIVRFHQIADQIRARRTRLADVSEGAVRFLFGLVKKVVVADSVGGIADAAFALPQPWLSTGAAWLGLLACTLQIYFDFSGYSDMAIGLGRMFGFRLPENFDRPYSALSITDFWRRWHMTLSAWFRDYLYLPLGGSRRGTARTYRNLVAVFLLVGLWHGANWTFVAWGVYHGALLIFERVSGRRFLEAAPRPALQRALTLLLVVLGWVLFRATDLAHAGSFYAALCGLGGDPGSLAPGFAEALTTRNLTVLCLATLVFVLPRGFRGGPTLERAPGRWLDAARAALLLVAAPYAAVLILSGSYQPFLYFQF